MADRDLYRAPDGAVPEIDGPSTWRRLGYRLGQLLLVLSVLLLALLAWMMWGAPQAEPRHGGAYLIIGGFMMILVVVLPMGGLGAPLLATCRRKPHPAILSR